MATPRTTDRTETSKKAFMREPKTLENKIKKEEEQVENEVRHLSNHVFYNEKDTLKAVREREKG